MYDRRGHKGVHSPILTPSLPSLLMPYDPTICPAYQIEISVILGSTFLGMVNQDMILKHQQLLAYLPLFSH